MKFRKEMPDSGGSKNFIKLKDKESITGIFAGEFHEFFVVWENQKTREAQEGDPGAKFRFRINFIVKDGSGFVPKIFENGAGVYEQLAELNREYPLEETVVKITRNGMKLDTTYSILPTREQPSKETMKYIKSITLLPLEKKDPTVSFEPPTDWEREQQEVPF